MDQLWYRQGAIILASGVRVGSLDDLCLLDFGIDEVPGNKHSIADSYNHKTRSPSSKVLIKQQLQRRIDTKAAAATTMHNCHMNYRGVESASVLQQQRQIDVEEAGGILLSICQAVVRSLGLWGHRI